MTDLACDDCGEGVIIVPMTEPLDLDALDKLGKAAAEYVAAHEHAMSRPPDAPADSEAWMARGEANDRFQNLCGPRKKHDDPTVQVARLVASFAPLVDEVRRLRELIDRLADQLVEHWHDTEGDCSLAEYMGLTNEECGVWAAGRKP